MFMMNMREAWDNENHYDHSEKLLTPKIRPSYNLILNSYILIMAEKMHLLLQD